jgi:hypothetical protein
LVVTAEPALSELEEEELSGVLPELEELSGVLPELSALSELLAVPSEELPASLEVDGEADLWLVFVLAALCAVVVVGVVTPVRRRSLAVSAGSCPEASCT